MKRFFLIIILISSIFNESYSQGTDISLSNLSKRKFYFGINLMPSESQIVNDDVLNSTNLTTSSNSSIDASIESGLFFSKNFGISVGLGYSSYSSELKKSSYSNSYNTVDSENDSYTMQISASNIIENQKISCIDVPLLLLFQIPFSDNFGLYLNSGIKFWFPVVKKYTYDGIFSYQGYYSEYNVTLYDVPEYGFPSNLPMNSKEDLGIKSINMNAILAVGIFYSTSPKTILFVGYYYDKGLSNISDYDNFDFQLSRRENDYSSLMSSASKVTTKAYGLQVSLKYFFK